MSPSHTQNPFPGLRAFNQDEDYLFFGREEQTMELLQRLGSNRFVAVVGTSGSGKSSLVRCGLLSELLGGKMLQAGSSWEVAVTHPGGNPMALLTDSIIEADLYDPEEEHVRENLLATLSRSHFGLVEAVRQSDLGEGSNFLLVVDQFEEIFRFHEAGHVQQEIANEFVSLLLEAIEQSEVPIYVVLTMRSDFIGECGQFEGLAESVNRSEFLIPRLNRDQYKRVIEGPIKVAGGKIEPRLLQRLLNDLGQQADQLPCLQHALMRTWDVWTQNEDTKALDLDDYQHVGRMTEALSQHADEVYAALSTDRQRELCMGAFQALTIQESENRGIRRPQRLRDLCQILDVSLDELRPIIDAYRQPGVTFLMPPQDVELTDSTIIDISHESLMRVWTRLRQWVEDEAQAAGIYYRLSESAALHRENKAGLYRNPELGIALAWRDQKQPNSAWAERYLLGFDESMAFLDESQRAEVAAEKAREAARQKELAQAKKLAEAERQRALEQERSAVRLRWLVRGLGLVAMVAIAATVIAWNARKEAQNNALLADQQREAAVQSELDTQEALTLVEAQKAEVEASKEEAVAAEKTSRQFRYATDIQLAAIQLKDKDTIASEILARLADHDPDQHEELDKEDDQRGFEWRYLKKAVDSNADIITKQESLIVDSVLMDDGILLTLDKERQLQRWDTTTQNPLGKPLKLSGFYNHIRLAPNGQIAAIPTGDSVKIIDTTTGANIIPPIAATVKNGLIFSPDSSMLITIGDEIGWWDITTGKPLASQAAGKIIYFTRELSTSSDGFTVAINSSGAAHVFRMNPQTREIKQLPAREAPGSIRALALHPNGQSLYCSSFYGGSILRYDTATGKILDSNTSEHLASISSISFSQDGTQIITGSIDGAIKIWSDIEKLESADRSLLGHTQAIRSAFFSPDGQRVISTSEDQTTRLWDLSKKTTSQRKTIETAKHSHTAAFSPDGLLIAVHTRSSSSISLWEASSGRLVQSIPRVGEGRPDSIAFSPDNQLLAIGYGSAEGVSHVELWNIDQQKRMAILEGTTDLPGFATSQNNGAPCMLAFSPNGQFLAAGFGRPGAMVTHAPNSVVKVWDVATRQVVRTLEDHNSYCVAVSFSPDGTRLATASYDGTAILWDTTTWTPLHTLQNPDDSTPLGKKRVADVAFSPDGQQLAMASHEKNAHIFDATSGEHLQTLKGHNNLVKSVAYSPDGLTLATSGEDNTVRLWNTATWREVMVLDSLEGHFESCVLVFSADGNLLLGAGGSVYIWSARPVEDETNLLTQQLLALLQSKADFQNRIRLIDKNPRLHAALEQLQTQKPDSLPVQAALAASTANQHAAIQEWPQAVEAYERFKSIQPSLANSNSSLPSPYLLRFATAYAHQGQLVRATSLLIKTAKLRPKQGDGAFVASASNHGFIYDNAEFPSRVSLVTKGSPAARNNLHDNDLILEVNGVETLAANADQLKEAFKAEILLLKVQHPETGQEEQIKVVRKDFFQDDWTEDLLNKLLADADEALAQSPTDINQLALRAEIHRQWRRYDEHIADATAAIDLLVEQPATPANTQQLQTLYRHRGDAYLAQESWRLALADYQHLITDTTTDEDLLTNYVKAKAADMLDRMTTVLTPNNMKSKGGAKFATQEDDSILVSGNIPVKDTYTLTFDQLPSHITSLKLETIPDKSLPEGGSGRHVRGNFKLKAIRMFIVDKKGDSHPSKLINATSNSKNKQTASNAIDGNQNTSWTVYPNQAKPHHARFVLAQTLRPSPQSKLIIEIDSGSNLSETLGRFRLSVSSLAPNKQSQLAAIDRKLTHPWTELAALYRITEDAQAIDQLIVWRPQQAHSIGDLFANDKAWPRAIEIYSMGLASDPTNITLHTQRAKAFEQTKNWQAAAADWLLAAANDEERIAMLAAFTDRLEKVDQNELANTPRQQVIQLYENMLKEDPKNETMMKILAQLISPPPFDLWTELKTSSDRWTVLTPTSKTSKGGATLTLLDDDSVLASGINPDDEVYEIEAQLPGEQYLAIRLEGLIHESLPLHGHGRGMNSNVDLTEFEVQVASLTEPAQWQTLKFDEAWADHTQPGTSIADAIDGDRETPWTTEGYAKQENRTAIFIAQSPFGFNSGTRFKIRLRHEAPIYRSQFGRFRLSAALKPQNYSYQPSAARTQLASAYALNNQIPQATHWFQAALNNAKTDAAKSQVFKDLDDFAESNDFDAYDEILAELLERHSNDKSF